MKKERSLLEFSSDGKIVVPEGAVRGRSNYPNGTNVSNSSSVNNENVSLRKSSDLAFLEDTEDSNDNGMEDIYDNSGWALHSAEGKLDPLKFSNGKTQEDVVKEVADHIKGGKKLVFIHGVCGTGKSAIALHLARELGKASIVVPVKGLQRQYEEDYMSKKWVVKKNGKKMKIAMITGRDNHDSVIEPGKSCANRDLPDTIKLIEQNRERIEEYFLENPLVEDDKKRHFDYKKLKRMHIAPSNPYWSPILPESFDPKLNDARKRKYRGLNGRDFVFHHRKKGCSYYDQYLAYIYADTIIYNSAKYKIEVALDKKPETAVDIIDEADEFLDNFSTQEDINLTRLHKALKGMIVDDDTSQEILDKIVVILEMEHKNKLALGVDEEKIVKISETGVGRMLGALHREQNLQAEIEVDDTNYGNRAIEVADQFNDMLDDTYVTFKYDKDNEDLVVSLVSANLSKRFKEIVDKNNALVLMSGTLHSPEVLKSVFGLDDFVIVEAEAKAQGDIEIVRTGKEFDCRYSNLKAEGKSPEDYFNSLRACMEKAERPTLVHVNAYNDLPSDHLGINDNGLMSKELLYSLQKEDKTGRMISMFKSGMSDTLFSTRCARGVDFPGKQCHSIVFTKYPNPNVKNMFWKILQMTRPQDYWAFYKDRARREFLQRLYRGLRSKDDYVKILSPDMRVLDAVRQVQEGNG